jgi:hypothetical protein
MAKMWPSGVMKWRLAESGESEIASKAEIINGEK